MKKTIVLFTVVGALAFGCSSEEITKESSVPASVENQSKETLSKDTNKNTGTNKDTNKKVITKHEDKGTLITNVGAGRYVLGHQLPIPYPEDDYRIKKEVKEVMEEGEKREEITFVVTEGDEVTMRIVPMEKEDPDKVLRTMDALIILSPKYKTSKGIGVGSTIEDFISKYPDYSLWYSYISDRFVLKAPHFQVNFYLDAKDFIGKKDTSSDKVAVDKKDFKSGAKIQSIRVY